MRRQTLNRIYDSIQAYPFLLFLGCMVMAGLSTVWSLRAEPPKPPLSPSLARASLLFTNGGSERCVVASTAASMNDLTAVTWLLWIYPTTTSPSNNHVIMRKDTDPASLGKFLRVDSATAGKLVWAVGRATTNARADSDGNGYTANAWQFVAVTYDETDGPRIFHATLTGAVTEVTYAATFPQVGSGATTTDSTTLWFGNQQAASPIRGFPGRIAYASYWNFRMTLPEIQAHKFQPFCSSSRGCVGAWHFGWAGTGTQPDLSGNGNNCTVTGATVADHAPHARWP